MGAEREVRYFRNGRNKAVRIPRDWELPGDSAIMRKDGDRLIIEPVIPKATLAELLDRWAEEPPLEEEWEEPDDPPPEPVEF